MLQLYCNFQRLALCHFVKVLRTDTHTHTQTDYRMPPGLRPLRHNKGKVTLYLKQVRQSWKKLQYCADTIIFLKNFVSVIHVVPCELLTQVK